MNSDEKIVRLRTVLSNVLRDYNYATPESNLGALIAEVEAVLASTSD